MTYLEHVGKYFVMLGRVFKMPQKPLIFYQALLKEIEDLGSQKMVDFQFSLLLDLEFELGFQKSSM